MDIFQKTTLIRSGYFAIILLLLALDQYTKLLIIDNFSATNYYLVNNFLNIVRVHNTGAAFGILAQYGGWQLYLLSTFAIIVSLIICYYLLITSISKKILMLSLVLIASGAIGNTLDRFFYGFVIDFLDFHYLDYHWPAFNIADMAIFIGAVLFILSSNK